MRLLFPCDWCDELMEEEYMVFWRVVNGKKVDETFLHFECEMDFKKASGKKHWFAQGFEATPEVHLDPPEIVKWKAEHPRE